MVTNGIDYAYLYVIDFIDYRREENPVKMRQP